MMSGRTDHDESANEERFLSSKLISKENSRANSSSRVYYYGGATVPFVWETCPGTPKHTLFPESSHHLPSPPPLTPPPSYFSDNLSSTQRRHHKNKFVKMKQTHFVETLFRLKKSNSVKGHVSRPSFSWSSTSSSVLSSSSSSSSFSSSSKKLGFHRKTRSLSCSRSPVPYVKDDDAAEEEELRSSSLSSSPTSTLCYGSKGGKRGFCCSMEGLKRVLFSVRIHGSKNQDLISDRVA